MVSRAWCSSFSISNSSSSAAFLALRTTQPGHEWVHSIWLCFICLRMFLDVGHLLWVNLDSDRLKRHFFNLPCVCLFEFIFLSCVSLRVYFCFLHKSTTMASVHQSVNISKRRVALNKAQAVEIFQAKFHANVSMQKHPSPKKIAALFGIGEKTVRDIWKGRTWRSATCHMDPTRPVHVMKQVGRPKGSKDSKPRTAQRQWNAVVPSGVKQQMAKVHGSQQQAFVSYSIDDQLHEWVEGVSTPSELIDPFRLN